MGVIQTSISAFLLRSQPFERFRFPRWQSVVAITLLGLCAGLGSNIVVNRSGSSPNHFELPLWGRLGLGVLATWLAFWIVYRFCQGWLKRDERWDGLGDLFNLLAASRLVVELLGYLLRGLGVSEVLVNLVWVYSILVSAKAMSGAVPKAGLGYSLGGAVLGFILAIVAIQVLLFSLMAILAS